MDHYIHVHKLGEGLELQIPAPRAIPTHLSDILGDVSVVFIEVKTVEVLVLLHVSASLLPEHLEEFLVPLKLIGYGPEEAVAVPAHISHL